MGSSADEIRNNVGLTIIQRDSVYWHPFYEVRLDEEDNIATKYKKNMEQKKAATAVEGTAIEEIKQ